MPVDSLGFGWLVGRCGLCFWSRLPGRRCLRFCSTTAASAEQCQSVLGVEGEAADRLLAGRAEGHVYPAIVGHADGLRSEEHTSELQSHSDLVCRLLLEKKKTRSTERPV